MAALRAGLRALVLLLSVLLPVSGAAASPIYNGGPVMAGPNTVDFIWYGNWAGNTATTILPGLINNLSGSSYMNMLSSYNNSSYTLSNKVSFGSSLFISSTINPTLYQGSSLNGQTTSQIQSIVTSAISAGGFGASPNTSNTIFDVLTATNITVSGFMTSFCGWHSSTSLGSLNTLGTQYGFVGNPGANSACAGQTASSPNNNVGADAMASVVTHELFETITDPNATAWYDSISATSPSTTGGYENGDMCNFNFGTAFAAPNGSAANVTLNGTNYLLQQQWVNQGGGQNFAGGACATSLATSTPTPTPEPGSVALLASALAGLAAVRRRPKRQALAAPT